MNIEKIIHKGKTVLKKVKDNGEISYSVKSVYLGLDIKTGKPVKTTVTAKTLRSQIVKLFKLKLTLKKMTQQGKKLSMLLPSQTQQNFGFQIMRHGLVQIIH